MLRRIYDWCVDAAGKPHAAWILGAVSFAESSFFPVPPDIMLIPMALARPDRAWRLAAICTVASVVGGALGYFIGYAVFYQLAKPLIDLYGYGDRFVAFQALYDQYGLWVILIKGLTPIPYKIVTIASGAAKFSFPVFMVASAMTRGARFFLVAALLRSFGTPVRDFIERRLTLVTSLLAAGIVGGFLVLRLL